MYLSNFVAVTDINWGFSLLFLSKNKLGNVSISNGSMFLDRMKRSHNHFTKVLLKCVNFLCILLTCPAGEVLEIIMVMRNKHQCLYKKR